MPSHTPIDVSVVICALNAADTLQLQLDALARQEDAPPFEVLVADNGSTDGTVALVNEWARSGIGAATEARVLDASRRRGIAHARNVGLRFARGRIVAYCDADDVVAETWVSAASQAMARGAAAVTGCVEELTEPDHLPRKVLRDSPDTVPGSLAGVGPIAYAWGANLALRTDVARRVGGFDESLPPYGCDDIEFGIRLWQEGFSLAYEPRMAVRYRPRKGWLPKVRREHRAAVAQSCVWARHPSVYGRPPSRGRLWRSLLRSTLRSLVDEPGSAKDRALASLLALSRAAGSMKGMRRWVRGGLLGEPLLFDRAMVQSRPPSTGQGGL